MTTTPPSNLPLSDSELGKKSEEFVKTFIRPNLISYFNTGLSAAHFRSLTAEGSHAWKYQRRSLGKPQSALCRLIARWHTLTLRAFWEGRQNRFVVVHIHNTGWNFCVSVVMLVNYFRSHMGRRVVQKIYSEQNSEWHHWPQKFISVPSLLSLVEILVVAGRVEGMEDLGRESMVLQEVLAHLKMLSGRRRCTPSVLVIPYATHSMKQACM